MRIKFDFTAQPGTHFGVVQTLDETLNAIPGIIDMWDATADSVTIESGRVSAWTGRRGRQFTQATPDRRPIYAADGLRMYDPATNLPAGAMILAGAQLGASPQMIIATRVRIAPVAANTDLQYLWAGSAPILRIMYRETNSSNYLRANILASTGAASFDIDLPETQSDIGVVLVCNGTDYAMHVAGGASASFVGSGPANFTNLFLGTPNAGDGTLVGHQRRFGLWRHVPSAAELAAIMKWVA